jgi:hypothetical protein
VVADCFKLYLICEFLPFCHIHQYGLQLPYIVWRLVTSSSSMNLSQETHARLDAEIAALTKISELSIILSLCLLSCQEACRSVWPIDPNKISLTECESLVASRPDIQSLLQTCCATGSYAQIRNLRMWLSVHPDLHSLLTSRVSYGALAAPCPSDGW